MIETIMSIKNRRTNKPPITIPVRAPELSSGAVLLFGTALVVVVVKKFEGIAIVDIDMVVICLGTVFLCTVVDLEDATLVEVVNALLVVDNRELVGWGLFVVDTMLVEDIDLKFTVVSEGLNLVLVENICVVLMAVVA